MAFNVENSNCEAAALSNNSCPCTEAISESCRTCRPILCREQYQRSYRCCCDADGTCCKYPCSCRDPFWPEFAHPRTLSCAQLYSGNDSRCTGTADDNDNDCSCECNA